MVAVIMFLELIYFYWKQGKQGVSLQGVIATILLKIFSSNVFLCLQTVLLLLSTVVFCRCELLNAFERVVIAKAICNSKVYLQPVI